MPLKADWEKQPQRNLASSLSWRSHDLLTCSLGIRDEVEGWAAPGVQHLERRA
jgi:hypothetical protein